MRSTIFTSLALILADCSLPDPSPADGNVPAVSRAAAPSCFVAVYPPAFIASHPAHPVTRITLVRTGAGDDTQIGVVTSTRGPVAAQGKGGQWFRDWLTCDGATCRTSCGGSADLVAGPDGATLSTSRLLLAQGGNCAQAVDLATGGLVTFRLKAAPIYECTGD